MLNLILVFFSVQLMAQAPLEALSLKVNKDLPEVYDHATKLMRTTVENNNFKYHFIVGATRPEFTTAFPKVKAQILKTICSHSREKTILKGHRAGILYSYESVRGELLGEFLVRPEHCF
ncbi:MAG: hypothetical protein V4598_05315 [Bdellovibrionota bacterium]